MDEKPKLRPAVKAIPMNSGGERLVCLRDPTGVSKRVVALPPRSFFVASLLDGAHTLADIQAEYKSEFGDDLLDAKVAEITRQLDDALMLEGERFEAHCRSSKGKAT